MYRIISTVSAVSILLACLCQTGTGIEDQPKVSTSRRDILFDDRAPADGSGNGGVTFEDDEDLADMSGSGSGSGSGVGPIDVPDFETTTTKRMTTTVPTTTTTVFKELTECQRMRETHKRLLGSKYLPRCASNGDFESMQCSKFTGTDDCWCIDLEGVEIPNTRMEKPNFPDCDEGSNMAPCLFQLVKHIRSRLVGGLRPRCATDGLFDRIQCQGNMCFCVDEESGKRVEGTETHIPATPNCDDDSFPPFPPEGGNEITNEESNNNKVEKLWPTENPKEPEILFPEEVTETINVDNVPDLGAGTNINVNINIDTNSKDTDDDEEDKDDTKINYTGDKQENLGESSDGNRERVPENQILTQPGLLGGVIGGSVVLLLGLVLLIMFIVYRMRKKDEGSYPLDEPRKPPNYSYIRAPEREYYA